MTKKELKMKACPMGTAWRINNKNLAKTMKQIADKEKQNGR